MKLLQTNDKKLLNQQIINASQKIVNQQGAALIIFMLVLILSAATYFVGGLSSNTDALDREKQTQAALAEAKGALLGDLVKTRDLDFYYKDDGTIGNNQPITLSNPDEGSSSLMSEGMETANYGTTDFTVIGRLPWRSLGTDVLKDGWGECLWYAVSGRFKHSPDTGILNWDTQGQIDLIDEKGNPIASNLAALVISPGSVLSGQDRSNDQAIYPQCGGNYEPRNYLDTPSLNNAILGQTNYFGGASTTKAPDSLNKTFVIASNANYNDRFTFITVDDIFNRIMDRKDFKGQVASLLTQPNLANAAISGPKGTGNVSCGTSNQFFCRNWLEMLFLKEFASPVNILIDNGKPTACSRVVIFGGKRSGSQQRSLAINKILPDNYLESPNLSSFNSTSTPTADPAFVGNSVFDPKHPDVDVISCLK